LVGETYFGDGWVSRLIEALQAAEPESFDAFAALLPASAVFFVLTKTSRAGGHEVSEILFSIDFLSNL
jgi:hypothetical protein